MLIAQSLNNLQIALFNGNFECINDERSGTGKILVQKIMNGDQSVFKHDPFTNEKWKGYKYRVKVTPLIERIFE